MNNTIKGGDFSPSKPTEKVHYKGQFRIVGQIVNDIKDKNPIGYVIMAERATQNAQFKAYTVEQTKTLIERFKFVNAEIENGKIINTECSMERMPKFNRQLNLVDNHGILILGEITNGTSKLGYRVMDTNAKIIDVSEVELLNYVNSKGISVLNAKIVKHANKCNISAIKQEFTKIEKDKLNDTISSLRGSNKLTPEKKWIHDKHISKLINLSYPRLIRKLFIYTQDNLSNMYVTDDLFARNDSMVNTSEYRCLNLDREYRILKEEILKDKKLSTKDKEILNNLDNLEHSAKIYVYDKVSDCDKIFLLAMAQFALYDPKCFEQSRRLVKASSGRAKNDLVSYFNGRDMCSDKLTELYAYLIDTKRQAKARENANYAKAMEKAFKTTTFTTAKDIADLGFTINPADSGKRYRTQYGFTKSLYYLGNSFSSSDVFNTIKSKSRCLGDVASIAYIQKLLSKYGNLSISDGMAEHYPMLRSDIRNTIEIIITIAYMYNSTAMKYYVDNVINDKLDMLDIHVDYDSIAGVDYKLSKDIDIYYCSGFNVFLSDANSYRYKSLYLNNAEYINYRQIGIKHEIIHDLIQSELASTVSVVSSDNLETETIERLVGKLRFL